MKKNFFAQKAIGLLWAFAFLCFSGFGQVEIWKEDFSNDDGVGAVGPTPTITAPADGYWSVNVDNCDLSASSDYFKVTSGRLEAKDVDGTQGSGGTGEGAIWTSMSIDISAHTDISISVDASESGTMESQDFAKASYRIDGGSITQFGFENDDFGSATFTVSGLSGSSLVIYLEADNNSGSEYHRFDNIIVEGIAASSVSNPTGFSASATGNTSIELSFTANGNSDDVVIVHNATGTFSAASGTPGNVGDAFAGGTIVYKGTSSPQSHSSLTAGTQYFYKAWSYDGADYSTGVTADATTTNPEPTNHASNFQVNGASTSHNQLELTWADNNGAQAADGFVIIGIENGVGTYLTIADGTDPSDDTDWSDGAFNVKVGTSIETYTVTGLDASTTYDFKIYPYTNSGSDIDFKTGSEPSTSGTTSAAPSIADPAVGVVYISEVSDASDYKNEFLELYNNSTDIIDLSNCVIKRCNSSGTVEYTWAFSSGNQIPAGGYVVVSRGNNQSTFESEWGGLPSDCNFYQGNTNLYFGTGRRWQFVFDDGSKGEVIIDDTQTGVASSGNRATQTSPGSWSSSAKANGTPGDQDGDGSSLPIELLSFEAQQADNVVEVSWATATEINNDYFTIERSLDGKTFESIGTLSGAGTSMHIQNYHFVDMELFDAQVYYRLKQTDVDGQFSYSHTLRLNADAKELEIQALMVQENSVKLFVNQLDNDIQVQLFDVQGRMVHQGMMEGNSARINTQMLEKGIYILRLSNAQVTLNRKLQL